MGGPRVEDARPRPAGSGARRPWPGDPAALAAEQERLAVLAAGERRAPELPVPVLGPGATPLRVAAASVACAGPGGAGDPARAAAVLLEGARLRAVRVVEGTLPAGYVPALLAAREGPLLAEAVRALGERPDVLLVAAAGRDHPRGAGLALHLGAVLDVPSVGVTDRPLLARGGPPGAARGDTAPLLLDGVEVARWVRTAAGVRPVVAHAAWRTSPAAAAAVVLASTSGMRTPQPLREARRRARTALPRR